MEEVFTPTGKAWRVKCDIMFTDPKYAFALSSIVSSFRTSSVRRDDGRKSVV